MSHFSIPTSDQISKKHNHPCIAILLVHICNIYQTYLFDKVLLSIDRHDIRQRNQSPFLFKIRTNENIIHLFTVHAVRQSVGQSVSRSVGQSISRSVGHSVSQSVSQSVSPSVRQSVSPSVRQSIFLSVSQSVSQSVGPLVIN